MIAAAALSALLAASGFQILNTTGEVERVTSTIANADGGSSDSLSDGDQLVIGQASRVALGSDGIWIEAAGEGRLLVTGPRHLRWQGNRLRAVVGAEPLKLETAAGTVRLTGGHARVRQTGVTTAVEALEGAAVRIFADGEVHTVAPGHGLLANAGGISIGRLPKAPAPIFPQPHANLRGFRFQWAGTEPASGYVWEMATDPGFQEIILRAETDEPLLSRASQTLPVGLVFWRVSAVSSTGLEGVPSEPSPLRIAP